MARASILLVRCDASKGVSAGGGLWRGRGGTQGGAPGFKGGKMIGTGIIGAHPCARAAPCQIGESLRLPLPASRPRARARILLLGLLVAIAIEVCYRSYLDLIRNRLAI